MLKLHIKPIRHICSVKGCHDRNTYIISRSLEHRKSVYMCEKCIVETFQALMELKGITAGDGGGTPDNMDDDVQDALDTSVSETDVIDGAEDVPDAIGVFNAPVTPEPEQKRKRGKK